MITGQSFRQRLVAMEKRTLLLASMVAFSIATIAYETTMVWKTSVFDEKYLYLTSCSGLLSICGVCSSIVLILDLIAASDLQFFLGACVWNSVALFISTFSSTCPGLLEWHLRWTSAARIVTFLLFVILCPKTKK
jgi:hypothetical protein